MNDIPHRFQPAPRDVAVAFFDEHSVPEWVKGIHFPWNLYDQLSVNTDFTAAFHDFVAGYVGSSIRIDPRIREIVILRVATLTGALYERLHHEDLGPAVGLTAAEMSRLREIDAGTLWSPAERAVLAATEELVRSQRISDATWTVLLEDFDHNAVLELIALIGAYVMTAMVLKTFNVPDEKEPTAPGA